jgi:hypothetical protein
VEVPSAQLSAELEIEKGLCLDEYTDIAFSLAKAQNQDIRDIKKYVYALKLVAGTILQLKNITSPQITIQQTQTRPSVISASKLQRRRWEATATIFNAVVTALLPTWGNDVYQIYNAAIGGLFYSPSSVLD